MNYKQIIVAWKEFEIPPLSPRENDCELTSDFITTITGPRRAGKTYFCFQLMKKLLQQGISKENLLYLNFEDNRLQGAIAEDLEKLLEAFAELSHIDRKQKLYLFLDEIQNVKEWDAWVRRIHDTRKEIVLILTGSSSKMLSREISTKLRGRVVNKEMFPLSFKEILAWKHVPYALKTLSWSKEKTEIKKAFATYLKNGGYPALAVTNIPTENILQSYYESMLFKDIIERHKIEDARKLKEIAKLLFESVAREMSYTKIANKLKSVGFAISKNTVIEYIAYFEDAYLFFQHLKYEYSLAKQIGSIKKVYCIDNGLLNAVSFKFSDDIGNLMENLAYIELKRRSLSTYYHRKTYECDFLIIRKNKVTAALQVTKELHEENEKRELQGLLEAINEHALNEGTILTEDQEEEREIEGKKIHVVPLWKWLLLE